MKLNQKGKDMNKSKQLFYTAAISLMAAPAFAAFDVTDVTDELTLGVAAVGVIGAAALVMVVVAKVWKRLRGVA